MKKATSKNGEFKISVTSFELLNALQTACGQFKGKEREWWLNLYATKDVLKISATSKDISGSFANQETTNYNMNHSRNYDVFNEIPADVENAGSIAINARIIIGILKKAGDCDVTIETVSDGFSAKIKGFEVSEKCVLRKCVFQIQVPARIANENEIIDFVPSSTFEVEKSNVIDTLKKSLSAIGKQKFFHEEKACIYFSLEDENLTVISSNDHSIASQTLKTTSAKGNNANFGIIRETATDLVKYLETSETDELVKFAYSEEFNAVKITQADTVFVTGAKGTKERFEKISQLPPQYFQNSQAQNYKVSACVRKHKFLYALNCCKILNDEVELIFNEKTLLVKSHNPNAGTAKITVKLGNPAPHFEVIAKTNSILELLENVKTRKTQIYFNDKVTFIADESKSCFYGVTVINFKQFESAESTEPTEEIKQTTEETQQAKAA